MKVRVLTRDFKVIEENAQGVEHLNKGDVFLPKGSGWEYKVLYKVAYMDTQTGEYCIDVKVKKL